MPGCRPARPFPAGPWRSGTRSLSGLALLNGVFLGDRLNASQGPVGWQEVFHPLATDGSGLLAGGREGQRGLPCDDRLLVDAAHFLMACNIKDAKGAIQAVPAAR